MQMQLQTMILQMEVFQWIMKGLAGMRCGGCGTPQTHTIMSGLYSQGPKTALVTSD